MNQNNRLGWSNGFACRSSNIYDKYSICCTATRRWTITRTTGQSQVKDGSITCDSSCTATGDLVGAPKTSGPYTVTASGEVTTSSTVSKEVGPNDRVITPNGLQSESTSTVTGEGTFTYNTNDFSIPLETTSTSGEIKDAPNEHSGFEQDLSSTSTGDPTFTITR